MSHSVVSAAKAIVIGAVASTVVVLHVHSSAGALNEGSQVNSLVCSGSSSNASLTVASPQSDTIVNHSPITIQGSAENISQIDTYVDAVYSGTIAISVQQTSYTLPQSLPEGTHTITLVGNDVCNYQDVSVTLVVTYYPDAPPPILVDDGVVVSPQPSESQATPVVTNQTIDGQSPTASGVTPFDDLKRVLLDMARALDFDATAQQGGRTAAIARAVLFSVGLTLLLFGSEFVRIAHRVVLARHAAAAVSLAAHMTTRLRLWKAGMHGLGLVTLVVALLI